MIKIGFIPSHREPFDKKWALQMRKRTINSILKNSYNIDLIYPNEQNTDEGLLTHQSEAKEFISLFKKNEIDGLIIGMMTFGEEIPNLIVAEEFSNIPILIFGTKEDSFTKAGTRKSDSFCGTISTASGLVRRGIKFNFAGLYFPEEINFIESINRFAKICFAVKKFRGAKIGIIGPRPEAFETCAINEVNLIKKFRNKIVPITLLKLATDMNKIDNKTDKEVLKIVKEIKSEFITGNLNEEIIYKNAKMQYLFKKYSIDNDLKGIAVQCWTDMESNIGVSPCLSMGKLTDSGIMSACEVDVHGVLTMMAQYYLTFEKTPPFFIDWTIQHQENDNIFLAWHCGNAPTSLKCNNCKPILNNHSILAKTVGNEKSFGTAEFQIKEGSVTLSRLVEIDNEFKMLITKGEAVLGKEKLRGSWTWVKTDDLRRLYRTIIEEGFTHHASMIYSDITLELKEFCKFLDIKTVII